MNNDLENREREIFEETQAKQARIAKKMLLGTFGVMGIIFAILGAVLLVSEGTKDIGIVYLPMGLGMIVLGIILFFVIPLKYDYGKYKARIQKYGYTNAFAMSIKIAELEARIEELEKKNR